MKAHFEKIVTTQSSFKVFIYEGDNFNAPWHFHPECELTYILKGQGIRYVGNSIQEFKEGDFVLLGSNLPHCWKNSPDLDGKVQSLVFQWGDGMLGENWLDQDEFYNIQKLQSRAALGLVFSDAYAKNRLHQLKAIHDLPPLKRLLRFLELLEELSQAEDYQYLCSNGFSPNLNLKANNRIDRVYEYVNQHYGKKIRLDEVASLVSMTNEAFCRFFKKSLNKSFFTFINEYRINLACKMLIDTPKQVGQIAYDCGYESLPFFYRQFQKFMQCSPLSFRKMYGKIND